MAGDGIGKFETADGFFRHRFQLMQKREIVFVDDRPVRQLHRPVAVAVRIPPLGEHGGIEGHPHAFLREVRLEIHGRQIVHAFADIRSRPDDSVDEMEVSRLVQRLFPIVQRTDKLFALHGQKRVLGNSLIAANLAVERRARLISAADNLVGLQKNALAFRRRKEIPPHHAHLVVVISVGDRLSLPREGRQTDNGIILRLPHDFRQHIIRIFQQTAGAVDGRQLGIIPRKQTFDAEA